MFDRQLLEKLVNTNSHSYNKQGVDKVGEIIRSELNFMNCKILKHPKLGNLYLFSSRKTSTQQPKILLSGHSDTVHPKDRNFEINYSGNKMYGPGTNDMKAGLYVIIEILKQLYKSGHLTNIGFALNPNEELASLAHKENACSFYKQFDYALVFEEGTTESTPEIPNTPETRALVVGRKGFGGGTFKLHSSGGHSGIIEDKNKRANAILEAAKKIIELENLSDYAKGTTVNTGIIKGGSAINVFAPYCEFQTEYRVKNSLERKRMREAFDKLANKTIQNGVKSEFEWQFDLPPMSANGNKREFIELVENVAKNLGVKMIQEFRFGGSDANFIASQGVKVLDGFGPIGDDEHTEGEFVYLSSIEPSIKISLEVIRKLQRRG